MKLLVVWTLLASLLSGFHTDVKDPYRLNDVYHAMRTPGVEVSVEWEDCGEVNAYYYPRYKTVTMCRELLDLKPAFVRFVFAHELAHAVIMQRGIPFTGLHETAADELAAVMLSLYGFDRDVYAAGKVFYDLGVAEVKAGEAVESWYDEHPGHKRRGAQLMCLANGSKTQDTFILDDQGFYRCTPYEWIRARYAWMTLLGYND